MFDLPEEDEQKDQQNKEEEEEGEELDREMGDLGEDEQQVSLASIHDLLLTYRPQLFVFSTRVVVGSIGAVA